MSLDNKDNLLLNIIQSDFPLDERPFSTIGSRLELDENDVLRRITTLKQQGVIRQISAIFDSRMLRYNSTLVAMRFDPARLDEGADIVNQHPGVSHNYGRNDKFNLWFTLTIPGNKSLEEEVQALEERSKPEKTLILPTIKLFRIGVNFDMTSDADPNEILDQSQKIRHRPPEKFSDFEIALIRELQEDIQVVPKPYQNMAERLGISTKELLDHAKAFIDAGVMRRYAAVLRHRQAGYAANAMGVWNVPDEDVDRVGPIMASFRAVSHCYQRPRYPPEWPYSLFTMVHARTSEKCREVLKSISEKTNITDYSFLYSTKEYKKERVKYFVPS
ncbi:MAG: Lrp/AsnC family transcriptional regulator [Candidatus Bathyarchaeia archaeon]